VAARDCATQHPSLPPTLHRVQGEAAGASGSLTITAPTAAPPSKRSAKKAAKGAKRQAKKQAAGALQHAHAAVADIGLQATSIGWARMVLQLALSHKVVRSALLIRWQLLDMLQVWMCLADHFLQPCGFQQLLVRLLQ
jgi:hypothetical protein